MSLKKNSLMFFFFVEILKLIFNHLNYEDF